jgi:hypothetical protein
MSQKTPTYNGKPVTSNVIPLFSGTYTPRAVYRISCKASILPFPKKKVVPGKRLDK